MKKYIIMISSIGSAIIIAFCIALIILFVPKEKYLKDCFKTDTSLVRKIEIRGHNIEDNEYIVRDIASFYEELSNTKIKTKKASSYKTYKTAPEFVIYIFTSEEYYFTVSPKGYNKTIVNKGNSFKENDDIKNLVYKYVNNKL